MTTPKQKVGLHVSAAGGLSNAPENAKAMGAECFQFFSRSPRGGGAAPISDEQAALFQERSKAYDFESYIHTPYYINFASKNNKIYYGSINAVREELVRGTKLGVKYVVTHLGSAKDHVIDKESSSVPPEAIAQAIEGLKKIFETDEELTTELLLEISAGAGAVLGDSFDELATLLEGLGRKDVHVCLDTCHMFASGYDLRSEEAVENTMKQFRSKIGTKHLKLVHMNDSKKALGGRRDLHEHMGMGEIGSAGLQAVLAHTDFQNVNFILETKHDAHIESDLAFLKNHRS
jgi:deoxyribonuclease IV